MDRLERRSLLLKSVVEPIYTELKKLECIGLVTSRVERDEGTRSRRLHKITPARLAAVTDWTNNAPVDPPVLKHSVLLRVTFGHLSNPTRLKELLQDHVAYAEARYRKAVEDAEGAEAQPAWTYSVIALRWAAKLYAAERVRLGTNERTRRGPRHHGKGSRRWRPETATEAGLLA